VWCRIVRQFAANRPQGCFFVFTDHDDPSCHDVIRGSVPPYAQVEIEL
jgi:hypothetical protein